MDRRTLLTRIVVGFSAVAAAGFSIPFIRSMLPALDQDISLDVDLSDLEVGESKSIRWLGRNVLVVRREKDSDFDVFELEDPDSQTSTQPEFAENTQRARRPEHLVVFANCTHLGCEVEVLADNGFEGFSCPCHRSRYDTAGRVEQGAAAKRNLEVPDYDYVTGNVIRLIKV